MSEIINQDTDAHEIGDLYRRAKGCAVEGVRYAIQAGARLTDKKKSLAHGQWLPWLEANADVLGFNTPQTAGRLMRAAKLYVDAQFENDEALAISREIWGNTQRALPKPQRDDDLEEDDEEDDESGHQSPWDAHGQPRPADDGMPTVEEADESYQETLFEQARLLLLSMTAETRNRFLEWINFNLNRPPTPATDTVPKKRGRPKGSKNKAKPPEPVETITESAAPQPIMADDPGPIPDFLRRDAA
jgi:Protein of unknown function (DUF3102)